MLRLSEPHLRELEPLIFNLLYENERPPRHGLIPVFTSAELGPKTLFAPLYFSLCFITEAAPLIFHHFLVTSKLPSLAARKQM
jgi:hypothetical protein